MNLTTIVARAAAALVAAVAGAASYEHIASVAVSAGERLWVAYALPLAIDGLIVVGVAALLEDKAASRSGRISARLAVAVGVAGTLAANVASAEPTATARMVAVAAPVAFLLAVEVLSRRGRDLADTKPVTVADTKLVTNRTPRRTPSRTSTAVKVANLVARQPDITQDTAAAKLGVSPRTVRRHWPVDPAGAKPSPNGSPISGAAGQEVSAPRA